MGGDGVLNRCAVVALAPGRLYALACPYAVDGRVSWHPPEERGFAAMVSYLLLEGDRGLLIDSGLTVHREALLAQLSRLVPRGCAISILHTRLGEYHSLCNTPEVVRRLSVDEVLGPHVNADLWTEFLPPADGAAAAGDDPFARVGVRVLSGDQQLALDRAGGRQVRVFAAALRLLPTHWAYDEATRTLFTSDLFGYLTRPTPEGPWTLAAGEDEIAAEEVRSRLLATRYWWLADADTAPIAAELEELLARTPVARIAPSFGCVLEGEEVAARHLEIVLGMLR